MTLGEIWRRIILFLRRDRAAEELEDEMRLHVELRAAQNRERGMNDSDAERAARRRFGNQPAIEDASHESWGLHWADAVVHDLRYALRGLRRTPGLTIMVVITLALGLGVNGAMFSIIDRVFIRPPAGITDASSLRRLYITETEAGLGIQSRGLMGYPEFLSLTTGTVTPTTTYSPDRQRFGPGAAAPKVGVSWTGAGYFALLGVRFALGRPFGPDEEHIEGAPPVAIISDRFWRLQLGGDSAVIGRSVELDKQRYTVIGVTAPGFTGLDVSPVDVWLPLGLMPMTGARADVPWYKGQAYVLLALTRLAPRTDERSFDARETVAYQHGPAVYDRPPDSTATVRTGPVIAALGPAKPGQSMVISTRLAMVALLVLLIACANVGNLLLVRALRRRREIAVRLALGISRRRLVMQLLTEGLLLAALAGAVALVVSAWIGGAIRALLLPEIHWTGAPVDLRVAICILVASGVTGILTGLAPVVQSRHLELIDALKSGARDHTFGSSTLRVGLIVAQSALAVVLLVGAGVFVQSLRRVAAIDVGYDVDHLIFGSVSFDEAEQPGKPNLGSIHIDARFEADPQSARSAAIRAGFVEAADRLRRVPGIEQTALATSTPMSDVAGTLIRVPGRDSTPWFNGIDANGTAFVTVSPEYFSATGLRLKRGRLFVPGDSGGAPVVVISELTARALWPGREAIGQCVLVGRRTGPCATVVGVVDDVHSMEVVERPIFTMLRVYLPMTSEAIPTVLIVRASPARAGAATVATRSELQRLFPNAEPPDVVSMATQLAPQLRPWRLGATLFSAFGLLALIVAGIGIYSIISYSVGQRTHELGVRVTLGAQRRDLLGLVLNEGLRTVAGGVVLGVALAMAMGHIIASMLYATSPRDPVVMVVVAVTLLIAACVASLLPALRAARVNPLEALREE